MNKQGSFTSAILGHAVDLWRLATFHPQNPHSLSKFRQINAVRKRTSAEVFIETGTFVGNTAYRCSFVFDTVHTCEIDKALYEQATKYLSKRKNVKTYLGDATKTLSAMIEDASPRKMLVFLDGHFSGGETGCSDEHEPACRELSLMKCYEEKIAGVIVDDFRTFTGKAGIPSKSELLAAAEDFGKDRYDISVHLDQLLIQKKL